MNAYSEALLPKTKALRAAWRASKGNTCLSTRGRVFGGRLLRSSSVEAQATMASATLVGLG